MFTLVFPSSDTNAVNTEIIRIKKLVKKQNNFDSDSKHYAVLLLLKCFKQTGSTLNNTSSGQEQLELLLILYTPYPPLCYRRKETFTIKNHSDDLETMEVIFEMS